MTTLRTTSVRAGLAAFALVLLAQGASGQAAQVGVRIVAVKATTLSDGAEAPPIPDDLAPFAETLTAIPGVSRYQRLGGGVKRSAPGARLTFDLPREHQADVVATTGRGERPFDLRLVVTRPAPAPRQNERERVVSHEVAAEDGATYVVRVVDALGKGEHLVLLVTVGTGELDF